MTSKFLGSNRRFGFNLLRETYRASKDKKVQISPYNVGTALKMTALGSRAGSSTRTSFLDTFCLPRSTDILEVCEDAEAVIKSLLEGERGSKQKTAINIANALWMKKGSPIVEQFKTRIAQYFGAVAEDIHWNDTGKKRINGWVKDETKLIDKIIDEMPAAGHAILTAALYMKTPATQQFYRANDQKGKFKVPGRKKPLPVTYMVNPHLESDYLNTGDVEIVEYKFGQYGTFTGYLVIPRKITVGDLIEKLDDNLWAEWMEAKQDGEGRLALAPNMQEFDDDLKDPLIAMGLAPAFSDSANFLDMCDIPCKIGFVKHRTKTKWTRKGFEGAAVTAVGMIECVSLKPKPVPFDVTVNQPYLWFIEGRGEQLFAGVTQEPVKPDNFDSEKDDDAFVS